MSPFAKRTYRVSMFNPARGGCTAYTTVQARSPKKAEALIRAHYVDWGDYRYRGHYGLTGRELNGDAPYRALTMGAELTITDGVETIVYPPAVDTGLPMPARTDTFHYAHA